MHHLHITFIGGGNMAEALIAGLVRAGHPANHICVTDVRDERRLFLAQQFGIKSLEENNRAVATANVVVLAVKPQQMDAVVSEIAPSVAPDATLVSIAAGINCARILSALGRELSLVRVMPNTPALVGAGMSVLFSSAASEHRAAADYLMAVCGRTAWVENESLLHAVTALSGSGPAYFFLLAEAMQSAGVRLGLSEALAAELTAQTALGAGRMLSESGRQASDLRRQVTSPGGTTQAALDVMFDAGLPDTIRNALAAADARSQQLAVGK